MFEEFKKFAIRGNVVDMAVGIIVGAAFGKIVSSLVNDIITPVIALFCKTDFSKWKLVLREAVVDAQTHAIIKPAITMNWGNFVQVIVDFIIITLCIFFVVKSINKVKSAMEKEKAAVVPPKPADVALLEEIRDLLKKEK